MNTHTTWTRQLFVRELRCLIAELALFPDEDLVWATAPGVLNSAGNITLHLCGNLQHFVGHILGGSDYARNRDLEFSQRDVPRTVLIAEIEKTIAVVTSTLAERPDAALLEEYPDVLGDFRLPCGLFLQHLSAHLAYHIGQVGYLRRILANDSRSAGAILMRELAGLAPRS